MQDEVTCYNMLVFSEDGPAKPHKTALLLLWLVALGRLVILCVAARIGLTDSIPPLQKGLAQQKQA